MNTTYLKKDLMYRAAINARGERLDRLSKLCDTQGTVSTGKLQKELDRLVEFMKDDAVVMQQAYEAIRDQ